MHPRSTVASLGLAVLLSSSAFADTFEGTVEVSADYQRTSLKTDSGTFTLPNEEFKRFKDQRVQVEGRLSGSQIRVERTLYPRVVETTVKVIPQTGAPVKVELNGRELETLGGGRYVISRAPQGTEVQVRGFLFEDEDVIFLEAIKVEAKQNAKLKSFKYVLLARIEYTVNRVKRGDALWATGLANTDNVTVRPAKGRSGYMPRDQIVWPAATPGAGITTFLPGN